MDEARHVEGLRPLHQEARHHLSHLPVASRNRSSTITLQADHWVKIAIGMNMVVEGLALGRLSQYAAHHESCDLLRQAHRTRPARRIPPRRLREPLRPRNPRGTCTRTTGKIVAQFAFDSHPMPLASAIGGVDGTGQRDPRSRASSGSSTRWGSTTDDFLKSKPS